MGINFNKKQQQYSNPFRKGPVIDEVRHLKAQIKALECFVGMCNPSDNLCAGGVVFANSAQQLATNCPELLWDYDKNFLHIGNVNIAKQFAKTLIHVDKTETSTAPWGYVYGLYIANNSDHHSNGLMAGILLHHHAQGDLPDETPFLNITWAAQSDLNHMSKFSGIAGYVESFTTGATSGGLAFLVSDTIALNADPVVEMYLEHTGDLNLLNENLLKLSSGDINSDFAALKSPGAMLAGSVTWSLPNADAFTPGEALVSDAAGNLSFSPLYTPLPSAEILRTTKYMDFNDMSTIFTTAIEIVAAIPGKTIIPVMAQCSYVKTLGAGGISADPDLELIIDDVGTVAYQAGTVDPIFSFPGVITQTIPATGTMGIPVSAGTAGSQQLQKGKALFITAASNPNMAGVVAEWFITLYYRVVDDYI